jgi:hypothetical protein
MGKKGKGGQGEEEGEGGRRGVQVRLQRVLVGQGKQEVARSTSREPPRSSSLNSTMKTK